MQIKTKMRKLAHPPEWLKLKRWKMPTVVVDVEQPKLADGSVKWHNHSGNCFVVSVKAKCTHIL